MGSVRTDFQMLQGVLVTVLGCALLVSKLFRALLVINMRRCEEPLKTLKVSSKL